MTSDYDETADGYALYSRLLLIGQTDKAYHFKQEIIDGYTAPCWIPKSQCTITPLDCCPNMYDVEVASWFARKHLEPHDWISEWIEDTHAYFDRSMQKDD